MTYDYQKDIKEACAILPDVEGSTIISIRVNVVDPEFNVVYLKTDKGIFSLQGEVGGEYLGVHLLNELPEITNQDGYVVCKYRPFEISEGRKISQARQIGGAKSEGLEDCLRLGGGHYENEWNSYTLSVR